MFSTANPDFHSIKLLTESLPRKTAVRLDIIIREYNDDGITCQHLSVVIESWATDNLVNSVYYIAE